MKIGILTWFFADNYGARAQSFALQKTLETLGHNVEMINYVPFKSKLLNLKMCINHTGWKFNPIKLIRDLIRHVVLSKNKSIYNISPPIYSVESINLQHYDLVVLGSDAIFNLFHPMSDELYYGVGINTKKCTYSPSCEYMHSGYILSQKEKDSLKTMGVISVRDERTKNLLQKNGFQNILETLDPTFLYNFDNFTEDFPENNYILVYCFSDWNEYSENIRQFAKSKKLSIISIGRICSWADKSYDAVGLGKWVASFRKASYVITDSYHGSIFSIKNQKDFVLLSRKDKIAKISSLLSQLTINRPVYKGNESIEHYIESSPIDYNTVQKHASNLVNISIEYLKDQLHIH